MEGDIIGNPMIQRRKNLSHLPQGHTAGKQGVRIQTQILSPWTTHVINTCQSRDVSQALWSPRIIRTVFTVFTCCYYYLNYIRESNFVGMVTQPCDSLYLKSDLVTSSSTCWCQSSRPGDFSTDEEQRGMWDIFKNLLQVLIVWNQQGRECHEVTWEFYLKALSNSVSVYS